MNDVNTHPSAEKLQVKFHHQSARPADVKHPRGQKSPAGKYTDLAELQYEFEIEEDYFDIEKEFETQYEQFLTNISGRSASRAKR